MKLSVIIPAYHEEKNIEKTIRSIYSYLKSKNMDHEIIVAIDGFEDKTKDIAQSLTSELETLRVVGSEINKGKGFSVREGMLTATGDIRLFTDADNSTTIDHIELMLPYFDQGYDVVIASIAIKGSIVASGSEPIWRRILGKLGNLYIQILAVPGIFDTQRGFKAFSKRAAKDIFPRQKIMRWGFDVEVLALARKFGYKIKEVPIRWNNDPNSHVKGSAYLEVLLEVLKIRWNLITGKYR